MAGAAMSATAVAELTEGSDFEAKLAGGREGRGELPSSFFESYSAFANTEGGVVLLGLREVDGTFAVAGIADVAQVQKQLWDGLNNRQRVSQNLLREQDVAVVEAEGRHLLRIQIPRASRRQRPVFVGANPLTGTYRRGHEGDYKAPEDVVRRMLAEQVDDSRDGRILEHYGLKDLDVSSLTKYRNRYKATSPDHPWLQLDDPEFLRRIGGWARDREREIEGLTVAGLLMFGRDVEIREQFPFYMLDYQERTDADSTEWLDRLTPDGTWPGNLFEFYFLVIQRLFRDLRVPFRLEGDTRVDQTQVHRALREALVNTLIHADYTGRISLRVVKSSGGFEFRNPGALRMSVDQAMLGGSSDCRNRTLQNMFRFIGLGEQAGSGIPRIKAAWKEQQWRAPALSEEIDPYEVTRFTLTTSSLIQPDAVTALETRFGEPFKRLSQTQKLALVTAHLEGRVTHARLRQMTDGHSRDVTLALAGLTERGLLQTGGAHKSTYYFLPGEPAPEVTDQVTDQVADQVTDQVKRLLDALTEGPLSGQDLQGALALRQRVHFRVAYLLPALKQGLVEPTVPDKPKSRLQKYRLTSSGRAALARTKRS